MNFFVNCNYDPLCHAINVSTVGETPQRREFNYPRRIVSLTNRNRIEMESDINGQNKFEKRIDLDTSVKTTC